MDYQDLLKQHKLKVTVQRVSLLKLVDQYEHIDIDTLFENMKKIFPSISLSTLYKNINAMLENNLLSELKITAMKSKFEITKKPHYHAICRKCGKIEEFYFDIDTIRDNLQKDSNYHITNTCVIFLGLCQHCKTKK